MTPIDRRGALRLSFGLCTALLFRPGSVLAGPLAHAAIRLVLASNGDSGRVVDPKLVGMDQLKLPPFDRYNTFADLGERTMDLPRSEPSSVALPNGRTLTLTLLGDHDGKGDEHGHAHFRVRAQIGEPGKNDYLKKLEVSATDREPFFVAGQSYRGGMLLLAITIHA